MSYIPPDRTSPLVDPTGHLTDADAMELRRRLLQGTRLRVTVSLVDPTMRENPAMLVLPEGPPQLANALQDLADVLDPKPTAPGREEPLEAPELAETLATAYEAALGVVGDDGASVAERKTADGEADALLGALGIVLASAYLEGRRRA